MAWWQGHVFKSRRVPCTQDDSSIVRIGLESVYDLGQLVVALACVVCVAVDVVCSEMSPLEPVHRAEISFSSVSQSQRVQVLSRPVSFPDLDALDGEFFRVGLSSDKPQKLVQNALEEHFLGGEQREGAVREREPQLWRRKQREGTGPRTIGTMLALLDDALAQIKIRLFLGVCHGGGFMQNKYAAAFFACSGAGWSCRTLARETQILLTHHTPVHQTAISRA